MCHGILCYHKELETASYFISKRGPAAMTLFSFQKLDPQLLLSLTVAQQKYWHENSRYRAGLNFSGGRDVRAGDTFHDVPIPRSERNWTKKVDILRKMARNDQGYPFWPCLAWVMIPLSYPHPLYRLSVRQRTIQQRQDIPYVFFPPSATDVLTKRPWSTFGEVVFWVLLSHKYWVRGTSLFPGNPDSASIFPYQGCCCTRALDGLVALINFWILRVKRGIWTYSRRVQQGDSFP